MILFTADVNICKSINSLENWTKLHRSVKWCSHKTGSKCGESYRISENQGEHKARMFRIFYLAINLYALLCE